MSGSGTDTPPISALEVDLTEAAEESEQTPFVQTAEQACSRRPRQLSVFVAFLFPKTRPRLSPYLSLSVIFGTSGDQPI